MYIYMFCKFLIFLFIHKLNDNNFVYIFKMLRHVYENYYQARRRWQMWQKN
jgi:hypothetical protein